MCAFSRARHAVRRSPPLTRHRLPTPHAQARRANVVPILTRVLSSTSECWRGCPANGRAARRTPWRPHDAAPCWAHGTPRAALGPHGTDAHLALSVRRCCCFAGVCVCSGRGADGGHLQDHGGVQRAHCVRWQGAQQRHLSGQRAAAAPPAWRRDGLARRNAQGARRASGERGRGRALLAGAPATAGACRTAHAGPLHVRVLIVGTCGCACSIARDRLGVLLGRPQVSTYTYGPGVSVRIKEGALGDGLGARVWTVAHILCK